MINDAKVSTAVIIAVVRSQKLNVLGFVSALIYDIRGAIMIRDKCCSQPKWNVDKILSREKQQVDCFQNKSVVAVTLHVLNNIKGLNVTGGQGKIWGAAASPAPA